MEAHDILARTRARMRIVRDCSMSVYLDYNATTPLAQEALDAITAALRDAWANPNSSHLAGEQFPPTLV